MFQKRSKTIENVRKRSKSDVKHLKNDVKRLKIFDTYRISYFVKRISQLRAFDSAALRSG